MEQSATTAPPDGGAPAPLPVIAAPNGAQGPVKYGFVIDHRKCIGCHACTVACKSENDVPLGVFRTWVKYVEKGQFPQSRRFFQVTRCNHCDNAPCVRICPTRALYTRPDGIVDFDSSRCIGCKACMQACPYDALYIDPLSHTAAKCHYCAHRVDVGLLPSCVIACPEKAIIAGDLNDPTSEIASLVSRESVRVRKPEQGTLPKLFYIGVDEATIEPLAARRDSAYMWAERPEPDEELDLLSLASLAPALPPSAASGSAAATAAATRSDTPTAGAVNAVPAHGPGLAPVPAEAAIGNSGGAKLVYDVDHRRPWGWMVAAYLWTKSIGAGALAVAALLLGIGGVGGPLAGAGERALLGYAAPLLALVFTGITAILLVADLKRPERFLYILVKPNPRSWLVLGTYALLAFGVVALLWGAAALVGSVPGWLVWPALVLAALAAGYSAFLFGQAEGRDFWQSPLVFWHLLAQAVIAGASALLIAGAVLSVIGPTPLNLDLGWRLAALLAVGLVANALVVVAELLVPHANQHAAEAANAIVGGQYRNRFWGLAAGLGVILPLLLLVAALALPVSPLVDALAVVAAVLALIGLWVYEEIWVRAGQLVPLS